MKEKSPFISSLKFGVIFLIIAVIVVSFGFGFTSLLKSENSSTSLPVFDRTDNIRFVIDAGHGGEDAGAVASDGTLEKDLNLDVASTLCSLLELNGSEAILTRSDDKLLYDYYRDLEDYTGQKKVYDLKNRLKIAQERENSIYVGIHMNKFAEEKYSGLQVYYSKNTDLSYEIANEIRKCVHSYLQPQNNRQIKASNSSIYILHHAKIPAVLVECGFLSNQEELSLLKDDEYQKKLCASMFSALINSAT